MVNDSDNKSSPARERSTDRDITARQEIPNGCKTNDLLSQAVETDHRQAEVRLACFRLQGAHEPSV